MPVKNVKRKTNDGFEGVITGLNDKEKEIIASSVASGQRGLTLTGNHLTEIDGLTLGTLNISDEDYNSIRNGEIAYINATGGRNEDIWGWYRGIEDDVATFNGVQCISGSPSICRYFELIFSDLLIEELGSKAGYTYLDLDFLPERPQDWPTKSFALRLEKSKFARWVETPLIPPLPSDVVAKDYALKTINGNISWAESSGALNVVANPIDAATNTLTKLKVDDTTYSVSKISLKRFRIEKENLSHSSGSVVISYASGIQQWVANFLADIDTITEKGQYILSCRIVVSLMNDSLPIVLSGEWSNENPVGSRGIYANTYSKSGGIVSYFGLDDGIQASNAEYFDVLFNNISYIEYQVTYAIPVIEG